MDLLDASRSVLDLNSRQVSYDDCVDIAATRLGANLALLYK